VPAHEVQVVADPSQVLQLVSQRVQTLADLKCVVGHGSIHPLLYNAKDPSQDVQFVAVVDQVLQSVSQSNH
jgi:fibrillarin-like rRNA methylase